MNTKSDEADRILAQNDKIESQIEKLQEKLEQATKEINQAKAIYDEKQEKMHADAEAFWQASDKIHRRLRRSERRPPKNSTN